MKNLAATIAYRVPDLGCVVQRGVVEIPDNEFQRIATYPGVVVRDAETGSYVGDCWRGDACWFWWTLDGNRYGRTSRLRYSVRQIVESARVAA